MQTFTSPRDSEAASPGAFFSIDATFAAPPLTLVQEMHRLQTLHDLDLLDTEPEEEFNELVQLASQICNTPISLISLVDSERQWFKASIGTDLHETHRDYSFCSHAIGQNDLFIVEDATRDPRFYDNPLVTGSAHIRFYAGIPLRTSQGPAVGTLCVVDTQPRTLTTSQQEALRILARQVRTRLELRAERKALARANAELERLARTDELTGIANRRAFEERMKVQFAVAERNQRPVSVLLFDIDNFKQRNDRYGHKAGDDALRAIGFVLQQLVRTGDLAARIGGEEFAILLPEADSNQTRWVAERIQSTLADFPLNSGPVTVSIGVASKTPATHSWERLLECADDAMYQAKKTGKNRIVVHQEYIRAMLAQSGHAI